MWNCQNYSDRLLRWREKCSRILYGQSGTKHDGDSVFRYDGAISQKSRLTATARQQYATPNVPALALHGLGFGNGSEPP